MIFNIKRNKRNKYITKDNEEWRTIKDYPNYQISNLGNVRRKGTNVILKGRLTNRGYLRVALYGDNALSKSHGRDIPIHRLVIEAFKPQDDQTLTIDHINSDKLDNNLENLDYMTIQDNIRKANNKKVGAFNKEGNLIKIYESATNASKELNKNRNYISKIINNNITVGGITYKYI